MICRTSISRRSDLDTPRMLEIIIRSEITSPEHPETWPHEVHQNMTPMTKPLYGANYLKFSFPETFVPSMWSKIIQGFGFHSRNTFPSEGKSHFCMKNWLRFPNNLALNCLPFFAVSVLLIKPPPLQVTWECDLPHQHITEERSGHTTNARNHH